MDLGLGGIQLALVVAALAASVAWLVAAGAVFVSRRPPEPPVGPKTLRTFGDEKKRRYYAAVDDGSSRAIRAWRLSPSQYAGLQQGQPVTVRFTPNLGRVRWIIRAADVGDAAG